MTLRGLLSSFTIIHENCAKIIDFIQKVYFFHFFNRSSYGTPVALRTTRKYVQYMCIEKRKKKKIKNHRISFESCLITHRRWCFAKEFCLRVPFSNEDSRWGKIYRYNFRYDRHPQCFNLKITRLNSVD